MLNNDGNLFNSLAPNFDGYSSSLYSCGEWVGSLNSDNKLLDKFGEHFNGIAPSFDGESQLLYRRGNWFGTFGKDNILYGRNNKPFKGMAPSFNGETYCAYSNGKVLPLLPENPHQLLVNQKGSGSCYALTSMFAFLLHPSIFKHIKKTCILAESGNLFLHFTPDPSKKTGINALENPLVANYMKKQGYIVEINDNKITIEVKYKKLCRIADSI